MQLMLTVLHNWQAVADIGWLFILCYGSHFHSSYCGMGLNAVSRRCWWLMTVRLTGDSPTFTWSVNSCRQMTSFVRRSWVLLQDQNSVPSWHIAKRGRSEEVMT